LTVFVRLQSEVFDPGAETNAFLGSHKESGAFVSFVGTVRSTPQKPIATLTLEHYPALAQKQIERFAAEAISRFGLVDIGVIHRFGTLHAGEIIVIVMALSAHRQAAFDGASYVMDWLKTYAPFWKREEGPNGEAWVEAKSEDETARDRWKT
jgi:molybdopterin synthase catalytic subunit